MTTIVRRIATISTATAAAAALSMGASGTANAQPSPDGARLGSLETAGLTSNGGELTSLGQVVIAGSALTLVGPCYLQEIFEPGSCQL